MRATVPTLVDREDAVLVLVDFQERLAAAMSRKDAVVATAARLARVAALLDIPMVVTRQYPKGLGGTVPELEAVLVPAAQEGARVMSADKVAFCCAAEAAFCEALDSTGRGQVVLCGMETHICIAQTALALAAEGRQVQVVADACCSRSERDHDVALDRLRAAGVTVTTSEAVIYEAVREAGTEEFKNLLAIVKES